MKRKLKQSAFLAMAFINLVSWPAFAADWSGFYAGMNTGYARSNASTTFTPVGAAARTDFSSFGLSPHAYGPIVGAQGGYNWQVNRLLLGLEGSFDASGINGSQSTTTHSGAFPAGTDGFMAAEKINWMLSLRGRAGYSCGPGMGYLTAGAAFADVRVNALTAPNTATGTYVDAAGTSFSSIQPGWLVGAGYELPIASHWTVRGEYVYYQFTGGASTNVIAPSCNGTGCNTNVAFNRLNLQTIQAAINYKFGASLE